MSMMKKLLKKISILISKALSTLADCIIPTLPILIGVGMLNVLLIIIGPTALNILKESDSTYVVLKFVADAGYYFMPIFTAFAAANVFNTNVYVATLTCGAILLAPGYVDLVNANTSISIYNLPIALTNYGNQVIPSIILVWIESYIYNFISTKLNKNVSPILSSLLTILIMIPIGFCAIGPIGVYLSDGLVNVILKLQKLGPFGNAILCALIPYITVAGLGGANLSAMLILAATGCDPILFFSNVLYNNILGFVTLALYIRNKDGNCLAASIASAVAGTSEPAIFGYVVKDFKALLALTIGCFFGGLYAGVAGVKSYAMASFGVFGIITTIGPQSSILHAAISLIIGCAVGFMACFISHQKTK